MTRRLTDMQAAFFVAYKRSRGNATAAAAEAGYSMSAQRGCELTHHPAVQAAIVDELRPRMARAAHMASDLIERQLQSMLSPSADYKKICTQNKSLDTVPAFVSTSVPTERHRTVLRFRCRHRIFIE